LDQKLFGMGLGKAMALLVFFWLMTVVAKVVFTKHQVPGVTEIIQSV
jgi:hypothetical protein